MERFFKSMLYFTRIGLDDLSVLLKNAAWYLVGFAPGPGRLLADSLPVLGERGGTTPGLGGPPWVKKVPHGNLPWNQHGKQCMQCGHMWAHPLPTCPLGDLPLSVLPVQAHFSE